MSEKYSFIPDGGKIPFNGVKVNTMFLSSTNDLCLKHSNVKISNITKCKLIESNFTGTLIDPDELVQPMIRKEQSSAPTSSINTDICYALSEMALNMK